MRQQMEDETAYFEGWPKEVTRRPPDREAIGRSYTSGSASFHLIILSLARETLS